jgi:hypothetical protein
MRGDDDVHVFVSSVEWCRPEHVERLAFSQCAKARSWVESQVTGDVEWSHQSDPPAWTGRTDGGDDGVRAVVRKVEIEDPAGDNEPAPETLPLGTYTTSGWDGSAVSKRSLARPTGTVY